MQVPTPDPLWTRGRGVWLGVFCGGPVENLGNPSPIPERMCHPVTRVVLISRLMRSMFVQPMHPERKRVSQ
eukprot:3283599-Amphidinium_carterae.1